jgi:hypothetical protein
MVSVDKNCSMTILTPRLAQGNRVDNDQMICMSSYLKSI